MVESCGPPNHVMFARIDPDPACYYVYLMYHRRLGYRVGVTRGVRSGDEQGASPQGYGCGRIMKPPTGCGFSQRAPHRRTLDTWNPTTPRNTACTHMVFHPRPPDGTHAAPHRTPVRRDRHAFESPAAHGGSSTLPRIPIIEPARSRRRRVRARSSTSSCSVTRDRMRGTNTEVKLVSSDERLREAVSLVAKTRRGTRRTWRVETSRHEYDKASRSRRPLSRHRFRSCASSPAHRRKGLSIHAGQPSSITRWCSRSRW